MALIEVKVPQLSESVAEATLLHWHKKPGDAVARDENLIDIDYLRQLLEAFNIVIYSNWRFHSSGFLLRRPMANNLFDGFDFAL